MTGSQTRRSRHRMIRLLRRPKLCSTRSKSRESCVKGKRRRKTQITSRRRCPAQKVRRSSSQKKTISLRMKVQLSLNKRLQCAGSKKSSCWKRTKPEVHKTPRTRAASGRSLKSHRTTKWRSSSPIATLQREYQRQDLDRSPQNRQSRHFHQSRQSPHGRQTQSPSGISSPRRMEIPTTSGTSICLGPHDIRTISAVTSRLGTRSEIRDGISTADHRG